MGVIGRLSTERARNRNRRGNVAKPQRPHGTGSARRIRRPREVSAQVRNWILGLSFARNRAQSWAPLGTLDRDIAKLDGAEKL